MSNLSDRAHDAVTLTHPPGSAPPVASDTLRRALRYGERAVARLGRVPFAQAEPDLRAGWERLDEGTKWAWVRAAVRAGYEQDADEV